MGHAPDPGPRSPSAPKPPGRGPTQYPRGPSAPDSQAQWASAPGQVSRESRRAHRWVNTRAAGRGNAPPSSGTAQAGHRTASPRPRPSQYHTHLHIPYIHTCPPSLNSAGVWRRGHTRGPAAPQLPQTSNQPKNSSSLPLPPRAATREQGCGKTPPFTPLALQYFLIVSD